MAVDIFARTVALASLNGSGGSYTKAEIDKMFGEAGTVQVEAVDVLPTENIRENVIYLVPNGSSGENYYDECMYINGKWEIIGNTKIDLSNYYTKDEVDNKSIVNIALPNSTFESSSGNIRQEDYQAFLPLLQFLYTKCKGTSGDRFIRLPLVNINTAHDSSTWLDLDNGQLFIVNESYTKTNNTIDVRLDGVPKLDESGVAKYFRLRVTGNIENDNITSIRSVSINKSTIPVATKKYVDDSRPIIYLNAETSDIFKKEVNTKLLPYISNPSVDLTKYLVYLYGPFTAQFDKQMKYIYGTLMEISSLTQTKVTLKELVQDISYSNGDTSSKMSCSNTFINIEFKDGKATSISSFSSGEYCPNILATDVNYSSPYIPKYDGSPATKKYVDDNKYSLPIASADTLGGIKLGKGLSADENGVVSADAKNSSKIITLTGSYYITGENNDSYIDLSTDDCASIGSFILETGVKYGDRDKSKLYEASYYIKEYNAVVKPFDVSIYTNNLAGVNTYSYNFNCYFISKDSSYVTSNGNNTTIKIVSFNVNLHSETFEPIGGQITWGQIKGYLSKSNTSSYTPTSDYHPATKKYVDDSINKFTDEVISSIPTHQELIDNGFDYNTHQIIEIPVNYTIENMSMAYEFELNENGYYESNNRGAANSYSLCEVTFNNEQQISIPISYINSGESNYDYGIFGNIDQVLSRDNSDDGATGTTKVFKNCKGESSIDAKELTYNIPAGKHFIQIKYRKDGGGDSDNDSLQFKIPSVISQEVYENRKMATTKYVDDAVASSGGDTNKIYYYKMDSRYDKTDTSEETLQMFNEIAEKWRNGEKPLLIVQSYIGIGQYEWIGIASPLHGTSANNYLIFKYPSVYSAQQGSYDFWGDILITCEVNNTTDNVINSVKISQKSQFYTVRYDMGSSHNTNRVLTIDNTSSYAPTEDYNPATKKYVDDSITSAIAGVTQFSLVPVDTLPTENIRTDAIYAIPSDNPQEQDVRIEYVYINDSWEKLGNTKIDLSNAVIDGGTF